MKECKEKGYTLLGTGEMGIGNTTTGSAIAAALLHLSADAVTGRGAGLSDEGFARKRKVIEGALVKYDLYHREALDVMRFVGGFDIAGMAGAFIGGSMYGVPVIIDGMISAVAALVACRLCPKAVNGMLASHMSRGYLRRSGSWRGNGSIAPFSHAGYGPFCLRWRRNL